MTRFEIIAFNAGVAAVAALASQAAQAMRAREKMAPTRYPIRNRSAAGDRRRGGRLHDAAASRSSRTTVMTDAKPIKPMPEAAPEDDAPLQAPYAPPHETPFVFFDHVSSYGILDGVAQLTLEARRMRCDDGSTVIYERIMVAHLRCALPALGLLRTSIDGVIKLAASQATGSATAEGQVLN